jgi:peptidoglycan/xylan/chitin deacetylase (PgdA/CDA1 family)
MELLTAFAGNWRTILTADDDSAGDSLPQIADELLLAEVAKQPGVTIGSHTWMHPNLAVLPDHELQAELSQSLEWLRARFPSSRSFVSYPYGLSSANVEAAARAAGYEAGFLAGGGWLPRDPTVNQFRLPRYNVPAGLSANGFRLRLSGLGLA